MKQFDWIAVVFFRKLKEFRTIRTLNSLRPATTVTDHLNFNPIQLNSFMKWSVIWNVISGTKFDWDDPFLINMIHNLETNLEAMELVGAHNYVLVLT